jgi:DNA-binding GntR family transcriptional regulator
MADASPLHHLVSEQRRRKATRDSDDNAAAPKVTRAEDFRLRLADNIVRGVLISGTALADTWLAKRLAWRSMPVRTTPISRN